MKYYEILLFHMYYFFFMNSVYEVTFRLFKNIEDKLKNIYKRHRFEKKIGKKVF